MSRPAIGITAALDRVRWGPWEEAVAMVTRAYAQSVQCAGALALVLPPDEEEGAVDAVLDRVDGLLLSGGSDVHPSHYGVAELNPHTAAAWPERDSFELALARRAIEREMPLLGSCRGMELLNVACGGTLIQHLPDVVGHGEHRRTPGVYGEHEVRLEPGSLAARAAGGERTVVKSHHHQGVERLGDGLVASGWSQLDEIVEAIELPEHDYVLGVLWHPEEDLRSRVVGSLVEAARAEVGAR